MERGIVFSIEEFATFDGPGIRTTVFLKGCPLRCVWCHSPEGQEMPPQYVRSPNGCLRCGRCTVDGIVSEIGVSSCPRGLVRLCGEEYSSGELVEKLLKNKEILSECEGGVTFSGGEPLMQASFLIECLDGLKGKLHCALQTCGYCDSRVFTNVLKRLDYVLYDLKLFDDELHIRYTGSSNKKILKNFSILCDSGVPFCVRIPLIPRVTDTEQNLTAIANLLHQKGIRYVELMTYHPFSGAKYAMTGRSYEPCFDEKIPVTPHTELFASFGIRTRIL